MSRCVRTRIRTLVLAAVGVIVAASVARADTLLGVGFTTPQVISIFPSNVDFNGAGVPGGTALPFTPPSSGPVTFIFNAECSVSGSATQALQVDIIVDPLGLPAPFTVTPTNGDNVLCSGNGTTSSNNGWVSASSVGVAQLIGGVFYEVIVQARTSAAIVQGRLDDFSLAVIR